jgi:hypothetical protein
MLQEEIGVLLLMIVIVVMIIIEVVRVLLIEMMLLSTHGESDRLQIMGIRQFVNFWTGANQA